MKTLITSIKTTVALLCICLFANNLSNAQTLCNANFTQQAGSAVNSVHFISQPVSGVTTAFAWTFGDGGTSADPNPTHIYTPGNYLACLTVTVSTGGTIVCTATHCDSVHVGTVGVSCNAHFTHVNGTATGSVYFMSSANPTGTTYAWSFGDGGTATTANTYHIYATGNYLACLTVTVASSNGTIICTNTFCDSVHVGTVVVNCNAHFTHQSGTAPNNVLFTSSANPTGTAYAWTFGDGGTSTAPNPNHTYTPGNYLACLTVNVISSGTVICTHTFCDSVHVAQQLCNASFSHYSINSNPDSVHFYPASTAATTYYWTFGDGSHSGDIAPWHLYSASGNYYVCLTITTSAGATCTSCDSVHVGAVIVNCNAHFTHTNSTTSNTVYFTSSANPAGTSYAWTFGDGGTSVAPNPHHTYSPGNYLACLTVTVTSSTGTILCSANFCDSVHVGVVTVNCSALFTHQATSTGEHFTSAANPAGTTYSWTFGDGGISTVANPTHLYVPGNYQVCLTVHVISSTGAILCTSSHCDSIHIGNNVPNCTANFNYHHLSTALTYGFTNLSSANATGYFWHFGDGTISTQTNPVHHYMTPGNYQVCVTMIDTVHHCSNTNCKNVHVTIILAQHATMIDKTATTSNENMDELTVSVYPNPASDNATIHIENANAELRFKLFDSTGRVAVQQDKLTNGDFELNNTSLAAGMYYYQVTDENSTLVSGKLMIQK